MEEIARTWETPLDLVEELTALGEGKEGGRPVRELFISDLNAYIEAEIGKGILASNRFVDADGNEVKFPVRLLFDWSQEIYP